MEFKKNRLYFLAGATGTEILRRGFPTKLPLWSAQALFDKPELLKEIYIDYINAGADIITTNTFRTQRRTLAKVGQENETERINRLAVDIAVAARKEAKADRPVYIAGCMTSLEDCYRPDLVPDDEQMKKEHEEQAKILADTPIDFFLIETINTLKEGAIAAKAAYKTKKPLAISFTANKEGDILNGDSWNDAIQQIAKFSPLAIMVNCVPPKVADLALEKIKKSAEIPFGAYANGDGGADDDQGWKFRQEDNIAAYVEHCKRWIKMGATIIGGCCGTNPAYVKAYSQLRLTK